MACAAKIYEFCSSVPVTAVRILDKIILAGEGSFLHVYEFLKDNNIAALISHHKIFQNSLIHGIVENDENNFEICVYGGQYLDKVLFTNNWEIISSFEKKLLSHRILDVNFKNNNLIVLLANNSVIIFDKNDLTIHQQIKANEKCSLFSGLVYFDVNFNEYVIMSGTFFNQVLIWAFDSSLTTVQNPQHGIYTEAVILHRLIQHKGIITSIFYQSNKGLILTSSDDRSIQLWQVKFNKNDKAYSYKSNWSMAVFKILNTLFGHSSRIWKVLITEDYLISAGEDACCLIWNHCGENIKKMKTHQGKNIWAIDINKEEDRLITGGGDGSIRIWNLKRKIENLKTNNTIIKTTLFYNDYPRQVLCLNFNLLFIVTQNGQSILHSILENKCICLFSDANFSSYCTITTNYKGNIIAIGNIHGILKILLLNDLELKNHLDIAIFKGKILSIKFLLNGTVLLLTGPEGKLELLELIIHQGNISLKKYRNFILPNSKQRWVTCAVIYNNFLICGDRLGNILLYDLESKNNNPVNIVDKIHGSNGVTFIKANNGLIYSCGRNGILNIFEIESNKMILVQSNSIIKGFEWLTNIIFINEEIYILGFFSNKFVAFNLNNEEFIFNVECGGGHRAWDFKIVCFKNQIDFRFVCIKQKNVVIIEQEFVSYQMIIKNPFGGSDLKSVQNIYAGNNYNISDFCNILLTCGEDGYLNLTKTTENYNNGIFHLKICSLLSIKVVPSNLRTLSFISNSYFSERNQFKDGVIVCGGGGNIFKILSLKWKNIQVDISPNFESFDPQEIIDSNTFINFNYNSIYDIDKSGHYQPHITTILIYDMNEKLVRKKKKVPTATLR